MDIANLQRASGTVLKNLKRVGGALRRSPTLALVTSLAAGFLAGLMLRKSGSEPEPR